ncbi:hypothetical protein [Bradyrhizobium sp. CCGB01]|uniref:hypothetical protein n=1 Tax=Bradyrhizobium sp. CCGB01 TaxID=2949634 RepID=UPI0020B411BC|nr:hypothetical protein [Bradyrhizobium sp. CCGB01]MCP3409738.1 hypothetical protein [Bradyrhizobium sp. CCGB01]
MHVPTITASYLAVLVLICTALAFGMIRLRRSSHAIFNGGILLALGLAIVCALPLLSRLPWAEFADEAVDQAIAALQFLEATYVILTL